MSIRKAVVWLFDVGDGSELAALETARARQREARPPAAFEVQLYGHAEAIRVLYQTASLGESPPKPPRPKRKGGRGSWLARYLDSLSALPEPAGAKA